MGIALKREIEHLTNFKGMYETHLENDYLFTEIILKHEDNGILEHLETIHEHNTKGYISIFDKKNSRMRHYYYEELEIAIQKYDAYVECKDIYISQNSFFVKNNSGKFLKQLRALYVDLDVEKEGLSKEEVLKAIEWKITTGRIPRPTLVVDSGRGFHLIWSIENVSYKSLPVWQYAEDLLVKSFEGLGIDKLVSDSSRVLRLVNTINSKNGAQCKIINNTRRMYFLDNLLDVLTKKHEKRKIESKTKINRKTTN